MAALTAALVTSAIVGAASTGAQIYSAKKQSDAAKDAAQQQSDAGKEALALQREMWQQGQQNLQPWMQTGGWAATTLGGLMGMPDAKAATTAAPAAKPLADLWYARDRGDRPIVGKAVPRDPTATPESIIAGSRDPRRSTLGQAMSPQQEQRQSGYTRMRAPDGEEQDIPSEQVPHFTSLGATVV